ncbi:nucleotide excision repair TFIIH subunit [Meredithblackwellia eburnea MCA 4105]
MVKATKGVLVTCDPAVKQILLQLDETGNERFIIQELDDTHVLISADSVERIKEDLQIELEKNNYTQVEL